MSVNAVLDKITERNGSVIGCIARKGDRIYHNLEAFEVDCDKIADTVQDLLALSDLLEDMDEPVTTVMAEYDGNCIVGQRIDDSLLVAVSDHLQRGGYKKLQVGLNLQARLLTKALDEMENGAPADAASGALPAAEAPAPDAKPDAPKSTWSRLLNAVVAQAPEAPAAPEVAPEGKTKRIYRGQVYYD